MEQEWEYETGMGIWNRNGNMEQEWEYGTGMGIWTGMGI